MGLERATPGEVSGFLSGITAALDFGRERLEINIADLTAEQLESVPAGFGNSIATLAVHICAVEITISHLLLGKPVPLELETEYRLDRPQSPLPEASGETVESLNSKMARSRTLLLESFGHLREGDLDRVVESTRGRRAAIRWLLALLVNHQSQHLGQIQMVKRILASQSGSLTA